MVNLDIITVSTLKAMQVRRHKFSACEASPKPDGIA